jgi:hypothetical protein
MNQAMKTTIKILIFLTALVTISCSDSNDMLTVINADGSCYREFTTNVNKRFVTGDSIEKNNPFPVDIDATCQVVWKFRDSEWFTQFPASKTNVDSIVKVVKTKDKVGKEEKKLDIFYARIRINYTSVDDMSARFRLKKSHEWSNMKVKYTLDKRFRWFYTYYIYRETYPKIVTNYRIPIEKFMTKEEASYWFTGKPNILLGMNGIEARECVGKLEDCYNEWYGKNLWSNEYDELIKNYNLVQNKPVSLDRLKLLRDSIFSKIKDVEKDKMVDILNKFFKTDAFTVLWKTDNSPMRRYEKGLDNQEFMTYFGKSFNYKLVMPGKVTPLENVVIKGDTLNLALTAYRMGLGDYTIEAQSRKANVWAFILTGIILIVAVGSFLWKPKRK